MNFLNRHLPNQPLKLSIFFFLIIICMGLSNLFVQLDFNFNLNVIFYCTMYVNFTYCQCKIQMQVKDRFNYEELYAIVYFKMYVLKNVILIRLFNLGQNADQSKLIDLRSIL
jgi:hypothetical protein